MRNNLKMVARINEEVVVETRSSIKEDRLWTKLIEFASKEQYVYPGDFLEEELLVVNVD